MKKRDIEIGKTYLAKVSGNLAPVRITSESAYGGWNAVNSTTGREVRIRGAGRLRRPVDTGQPAPSTEVETPPLPCDNDLSSSNFQARPKRFSTPRRTAARPSAWPDGTWSPASRKHSSWPRWEPTSRTCATQRPDRDRPGRPLSRNAPRRVAAGGSRRLMMAANPLTHFVEIFP